MLVAVLVPGVDAGRPDDELGPRLIRAPGHMDGSRELREVPPDLGDHQVPGHEGHRRVDGVDLPGAGSGRLDPLDGPRTGIAAHVPSSVRHPPPPELAGPYLCPSVYRRGLGRRVHLPQNRDLRGRLSMLVQELQSFVDAAHRNSPEVLIEIPHLRAGVAYRGIVALTPSRSSCRRSRCTRMRYESPLMARRVARNRNRSRMAAAIMESEKISPTRRCSGWWSRSWLPPPPAATPPGRSRRLPPPAEGGSRARRRSGAGARRRTASWSTTGPRRRPCGTGPPGRRRWCSTRGSPPPPPGTRGSTPAWSCPPRAARPSARSPSPPRTAAWPVPPPASGPGPVARRSRSPPGA